METTDNGELPRFSKNLPIRFSKKIFLKYVREQDTLVTVYIDPALSDWGYIHSWNMGMVSFGSQIDEVKDGFILVPIKDELVMSVNMSLNGNHEI